MIRRKTVIFMTASVSLLVFVIATGIWSPYRWGAYLEVWRQTVSVAFYGRIIDEMGNPLDSVAVDVHVTTVNPWFIVGAERFARDKAWSLQTDRDGRFKILNQRGWSVAVRNIRKPGYEFMPKVTKGGNWQTTFYFAGGGVGKNGPHQPDPKNPVIFEMRTTR